MNWPRAYTGEPVGNVGARLDRGTKVLRQPDGSYQEMLAAVVRLAVP